MYILAGCPASGRSWVIKQWVSHLTRAAHHADAHLMIYTLIPKADTETIYAVAEACRANKIENIIEETTEEPRSDYVRREWPVKRYEQMVGLRNTMLASVRNLEPDLFLSIDSDILINRYAITSMIDALKEYEFDAVASKTWLHATNPRITNGATLTRFKTMQRLNLDGVAKAEVLMALIMMTPVAYWVDYELDERGEDLGWSRRAKNAGLSLGFDGRTASKHIMNPEDIHKIDLRVGW